MKKGKENELPAAAFAVIILLIALAVSVIRIKERYNDMKTAEAVEVFSRSGNGIAQRETGRNDTFYELFDK